MKLYTIVRNGVITQAPKGAHKCGFSSTRRYPYKVILTVAGELRPPQYFIVANEAIHAEVVRTFKAKRESESCERMVDTICRTMIRWMRRVHPEWRVERCHVELTGTKGAALLSVDWFRGRKVAA